MLGPVHEASAIDRDALEAAIVFNVFQFVEWPNEDARAEGAALTLCLKGDSPLLGPVRQLEGRPVRRMTLHVLRLDDGPRKCEAIYLDSARAEAAARNAAMESTLTIGGSDYRPSTTPAIQLVSVEGRLAFDIDQKRAQQAGLTVSSRLLRLARNITQ